MKKILSGVLASTLILSSLPMSVMAQEPSSTPVVVSSRSSDLSLSYSGTVKNTPETFNITLNFDLNGGTWTGSDEVSVSMDLENYSDGTSRYSYNLNHFPSYAPAPIPEKEGETFRYYKITPPEGLEEWGGQGGDDYMWHYFSSLDLVENAVFEIKVMWESSEDEFETPEPETSEPEAPQLTPDENGYLYATWAENIVAQAKENDLIVENLGSDFTQTINREQIAHLLMNVYHRATGIQVMSGETPFSDTNDAQIVGANKLGIIGGRPDGSFDPTATATRQEIAIMIYNTIRAIEDAGFTNDVDHDATSLSGFLDIDSVADWAKNPVAILVNNQFMAGSGDNLNPLATTTIQESLVFANRLFALG